MNLILSLHASAQLDETYVCTLIEQTQKQLDKKTCQTYRPQLVLQKARFEDGIKSYPLEKPFPEYPTSDAAAIAFANFVRGHFKQQFIEYCAEIFKSPTGTFYFKSVDSGSPGGCKINPHVPAGVAVVHTHPQDEANQNNLSQVFQIFSANDIAYAEFEPKRSIYLAAPAGHILRYDPGTSICQGKKVKNPYKMVQPPNPKARGQLSVKANDFVAFPQGEMPTYCKK